MNLADRSLAELNVRPLITSDEPVGLAAAAADEEAPYLAPDTLTLVSDGPPRVFF